MLKIFLASALLNLGEFLRNAKCGWGRPWQFVRQPNGILGSPASNLEMTNLIRRVEA